MTVALRQRPLARVVMGIVKSANGAWFDPSDMSTLYQDAAGTTPVTAVEQPVGLMLDKSRGMMLGPELISNGTFDSGIAGWEQKYNATTSYSLGSLKVMPAIINTNGAFAGQAIPTAIGRSYKVTFDLVTANAATYIRALNNINAPWVYTYGIAGAAVGNKSTLVFTATATVTYIAFGVSGSESLTNAAVYDNISVRELYGYHATQSITASRPTLSARYNLLTKTEDFSDSVWGSEINLTTTSNTAIAPDGTLTVDTITTTAVAHAKFQAFTCVPNTQYTFSFYAKRGTMTDAKYSVYDLTGASNIVAATSYYSAINAGTFSRVSITFTTPANCISCRVYPLRDSGVIGTIHMWGADVRLGLSGPYQRVNTATDYDTDERYFKKYLRFDGVDDYLNLPYMGLYANGSASVIFCLDDRTQAGNARAFSESSATTSSQYSLRNITSGGFDSYIADDAGASFVDSLNTKGVESKNYIISVIDSGLNVTRYRNSTYENTQAYSRAGKAFTANKTTIGALDTMNTVVAYTAMKLYGLVITKSPLADSQRIACERYLGRKSGVQL